MPVANNYASQGGNYAQNDPVSQGPVRRAGGSGQPSGGYNPEKDLQDMYRAQLSDYEKYQKPILEALAKEAESNEIVRIGNLQASQLRDRAQGQVERTLSLGMETLLPSQRAAMRDKLDRDTRVGDGGIRRGASLAQEAHNTATRTNLMSISESLQTTGVAGVSSAAAAKAQRDEAASKSKGNMMGQIGSIAGGVIGGIYGDPMGAQIGATVGGTAGSAIGGGG